MFWIAAALLTLGASLAVLLPLTARAPEEDARDKDLAVYRDQLAEVERDRTRGLIPDAAVAEARAEIGRRILRLDAAAEPAPAERRSRLYGAAVAALVLFVPVLGWGAYAALGSPDLPPQPLSARLEKPPGESTVEELLARAERRLTADPEDGRGWSVVAPIYLRLGRFEDAVSAYRNSLRLSGASADREAGLGEALAAAAGGAVTAQARAAFERALALDPRHPLARFQLAAAAMQEGRAAEAAAAWNGMLADLPPDSPWRGMVAQAIAEAGSGAPDGGAKGPDDAQVKEVQAMPAGERTAMIEGMVAGLDERLRSNPRDPEGWMRLVRSYLVLERPDAARDALARGRAALGAESAGGRQLLAFAASLGLAGETKP